MGQKFGREMRLALGLGACLTALGTRVASAQTQEALPPAPVSDPVAAQPQTSEGRGSDIVVTGSRAIRNGNAAPTPVTVVSAAQLQAAAPTTVADALNQLPVLANSSRPTSAGSSGIPGQATGNGANILNLRGLGAQRTLVLLDGRRLAPTNALGSTDINLIPEDLLQRVDIVTGGASAAYGSDAVAGVVNFVLNKRFTGLRLSGQAGVSSRKDNGSQKLSGTFGATIADAVNLVGGVTYFHLEGVDLDYGGREWAERGWGIIPTGGTPTSIIAPDVRYSTATYGGLITSGVLAGNHFLPGGTLTRFNPGQYRSATLMSGGDGAAGRTNLIPALTTLNGFVHVDSDIGSGLNVFAEGAVGKIDTDFPTLTGANQQGATAFTIYNDNAFLPAAVRSAMAAANQTSFTLGRYDRDWGPITVDVETETVNLTGGVEGDLGGSWRFSAYYNYGRTVSTARTDNNPILANVYAAADAVVSPATGQIVCRISLTNAANAANPCVPINLFGEGAPSPTAIDYVSGSNIARLVTKQQVAAVDLRGEPLSLWAGPVTFAIGAEWRKQEAVQTVDAISRTVKAADGIRGYPTNALGTVGGFQQTNAQPIAGEFDIREGFLELNIPLLKDSAIARSLDLNGAVRYADYSSVGGVTTWKAGLSWRVVDDLRLRATRSRDVRAPNIQELFQPSQQVNGQGARDPNFGGTSFAVVQRITGNVDLGAENADTLTIGGIYQPSWFPGLSVSVDYFKIDIADVITALTVQQVVDGCFGATTEFCSLITRNPAGVITSVTTPTFNLAALESEGVDVEVNLTKRLADISEGLSGNFTLRALATYTSKLATTNGAVTIDRAGDLGTTGTPHWIGTLTAIYDNGPFELLAQERYIGPGKYDAALTSAQLADNRVKAVFYTDVTARIGLGEGKLRPQLFLTVNNLFDRDPPITPNGAVTTPRAANGFRYDFVGRYFTFGTRVQF
jgi:iron complex outermembrane receptor protein